MHTEKYDDARSALQNYINRNPADPKLVMNRTLEYIYTLDNTHKDQTKVVELTSFLLNSILFTDEETKRHIPEHQIASVYDKHQLSLAWNGNIENAKDISIHGMNNYYPQTLAGANCAMSLAVYLYSYENELIPAEDILRDILLNAPYPSILPWVKKLLADIEFKKGNYSAALYLVNESIILTHTSYTYSMSRCKSDAEILKAKIINSLNQ